MLLIYQETKLAIGIVVSARNSSALGAALLPSSFKCQRTGFARGYIISRVSAHRWLGLCQLRVSVQSTASSLLGFRVGTILSVFSPTTLHDCLSAHSGTIGPHSEYFLDIECPLKCLGRQPRGSV